MLLNHVNMFIVNDLLSCCNPKMAEKLKGWLGLYWHKGSFLAIDSVVKEISTNAPLLKHLSLLPKKMPFLIYLLTILLFWYNITDIVESNRGFVP